MPDPLIMTPEALDAAIAASVQVRRARLERALRRQRTGVRVAFGLCACMALFSVAAFFLAHDDEAAGIIAMMTVMTFALAYLSWKFGRNKLVRELEEMGAPSEE